MTKDYQEVGAVPINDVIVLDIRQIWKLGIEREDLQRVLVMQGNSRRRCLVDNLL